MFVICFFFLFSLFNWRGSCFVAGVGFRRSRKILVGRPSFFVGACRGERGEGFGACCREEKGGLKKETPV